MRLIEIAYSSKLDTEKYGLAEFRFNGKVCKLFKIDSCSDGSLDNSLDKSWKELMTGDEEIIWNQIEDSKAFSSAELNIISKMPPSEFIKHIFVLKGK